MARHADEDDAGGHGHFRSVDLGVIIGVAAFGLSLFVLGRQTSPQNDCCERLDQRDSELLLCEFRLQAAGLPPTPTL